MSDLITRYNSIFEKDKERNLNLETADVDVKQGQIEGKDAALALLSEFDAEGWVETTDAVLYRRNAGGVWISPKTGEAETLTTQFPILNAEIGNRDKSLVIQHVHGDLWTATTLTENTGDIPCFCTKSFSVIALSRGEKLNYLKMKHRTYWDPSKGAPKAVRFTGFVSEGE